MYGDGYLIDLWWSSCSKSKSSCSKYKCLSLYSNPETNRTLCQLYFSLKNSHQSTEECKDEADTNSPSYDVSKAQCMKPIWKYVTRLLKYINNFWSVTPVV